MSVVSPVSHGRFRNFDPGSAFIYQHRHQPTMPGPITVNDRYRRATGPCDLRSNEGRGTHSRTSNPSASGPIMVSSRQAAATLSAAAKLMMSNAVKTGNSKPENGGKKKSVSIAGAPDSGDANDDCGKSTGTGSGHSTGGVSPKAPDLIAQQTTGTRGKDNSGVENASRKSKPSRVNNGKSNNNNSDNDNPDAVRSNNPTKPGTPTAKTRLRHTVSVADAGNDNSSEMTAVVRAPKDASNRRSQRQPSGSSKAKRRPASISTALSPTGGSSRCSGRKQYSGRQKALFGGSDQPLVVPQCCAAGSCCGGALPPAKSGVLTGAQLPGAVLPSSRAGTSPKLPVTPPTLASVRALPTRLTYFPIRGRAEPIRLILAYAGVPFQDVRVSEAEWKEIRENTQYSQLPILEYGDKALAQSTTIARFLGEEFGLNETDNWNAAVLDSLVESINEVFGCLYIVLKEKDGELARPLLRKVRKESIKPKLLLYETFLNQSVSGFFGTSNITWADFVLFCGFSGLEEWAGVRLKQFPAIYRFYSRMKALPSVAAWAATHADVPYSLVPPPPSGNPSSRQQNLTNQQEAPQKAPSPSSSS